MKARQVLRRCDRTERLDVLSATAGAQKTRREQMGRVKAGRIPGGRSYGYDVVTSGDDRGQRLINAREAAVVKRIYAEYFSGKGSLAIVKDLNREGEPGPSGGAWSEPSGRFKLCDLYCHCSPIFSLSVLLPR